MDENVRILCVDDETNVLKALRRIFMDDEYDVMTAESGEDGLKLMQAEEPIQIIISDYRMPGMDGVAFLKQVCERWPDTIRLVLSGYADTAAVVAAINDGQIYKFIPKPWNDDELKVTINKAVETYFLSQKNRKLTRELSESNEELQRLNANLEDMVAERTTELSFQIKALERSQHILDSLPVGVMGLSTDGTVVRLNTRVVELLGLNPGTLLGHSAQEALPDELAGVIASLADKGGHRTMTDINGRIIRVLASVMKYQDGQEGLVVAVVPETDAEENNAE